MANWSLVNLQFGRYLARYCHFLFCFGGSNSDGTREEIRGVEDRNLKNIYAYHNMAFVENLDRVLF